MAPLTRLPQRSVAAGICGTLGVLVLLLGSFLSLGSRILFDSDFFASQVADSLTDPRTASYVADQVTNAVVDANPDLILVRPLVKSAAQAVVSSAPFRVVAKQGVKRSHQLMVSEGGRNVLLSISDFGVILSESLADRPDLARMIPENAVAVLGEFQGGAVLEISGDILGLGQRVSRWPQVIFLFGMILIVTGVLLALKRELALLRAGIAVTVTAGFTLLVFEIGSLVVAGLTTDPALGSALAGVWSAFVEGLRFRVAIVLATGLLMTAAATAFLETMKMEAIGKNVWRFLAESFESRWMRLVRGLVLLLLGALTLLETELASRILVGLAGGVLAFLGMRELSRLAVDPAERLARNIEKLDSQAQGGRGWARPSLIALGVAILLVPGAALLFQGSGETAAPPPAVENVGCNGSPNLCDRPLDQVVFAGTHNSMGAADVEGWLFPNQQYGIRRQLEDGVRALMLDVLPGIEVENFVKTDLDSNELSREKLEPVLGTEGLEAALRIRGRISGNEERGRGLYLCHALCELGAQRLVPALETIREFLVSHPREILVLIIEDSVSPESIAVAFEESGLLEFVYLGEVTPPWPTLGEMVADGGRVLVLGENETAGVPWYHPAWDVVQETRYDYTRADEFDCAPNRGGAAGSLLLVNHWVNTPPTSLPRDAVIVNAREALMERVENCRDVRGRIPNIIAVDFYGVGDLVEVVEELNRVERD